MGSETGNEKSSRPNRELGMSPMESQARYGSIAGGGLKADTVSSYVDQINKIRQSQDREPSYTAQDLLRDKTATEMKYGREAQLNERLFGDDSGRTITPSMLDSRGNLMAFTAAPPTFGQLLGDAGRAFTGGTAFTRAAGLPDPSDQTGILAGLPKASPLLRALGINFDTETYGPPNRQMAADYVGQTGMFSPDRSLTPTTPSREELLGRVGIESIPDATDSPAFRDLTPDEILEQPLVAIDDLVSSFKKNAILDELIIDELNKEAGERDLDFVNDIINQNQYRDYQQYLQDYPDVRKNLLLASEPFDRRRTADSYIRR